MRTEILENAIKQYFIDHYEVEYDKHIPIVITDNYYHCEFFLNKAYRPIILSGEFDSDELFLNYIYKEIDARRMHTVSFSTLVKRSDNIYGEQDSPH